MKKDQGRDEKARPKWFLEKKMSELTHFLFGNQNFYDLSFVW